jgi:hypothetical protein
MGDVKSEIHGPPFSVKQITFDNRFEAHETGIDSDLVPGCWDPAWRHYKCFDIFRKIMKLHRSGEDEEQIINAPTAAWFDLCGGLTDSNYYGMQEVVSKIFKDGSLLFTTLAIDGVRGMSKDSIAGRAYSNWSSGALRRKIATDILLNEMVEKTGKYLKPVFEPYVYRRKTATTYAVFGYLVGEK